MAALPSLESSQTLLVLFFTMHMFGWIISTILLLTVIFGPRINRHFSWINLCISWIVACFSFSLLLLSGQLNKTSPNSTLCLIQAGAVFAVPTLTASATLGFAAHLWTTVRLRSQETTDRQVWGVLVTITPATPYIIPVVMYISVFLYGYHNPDRVGLAGGKMYCGVSHPLPGTATAIIVSVLMLPTLVFEGLAFHCLYKRWNIYSVAIKRGLNTLIRLGIFTFFNIFGIAINLSYLSNQNYGRLPNVLMSLPPVSFVLVFGCSMDILQTWIFWRHRPSISDAITSIRSNSESSTKSEEKLENFSRYDGHTSRYPARLQTWKFWRTRMSDETKPRSPEFTKLPNYERGHDNLSYLDYSRPLPRLPFPARLRALGFWRKQKSVSNASRPRSESFGTKVSNYEERVSFPQATDACDLSPLRYNQRSMGST